MFENKSRTEIKSLGEFRLIEHLTKDFTAKNKSTIVSVGDDAAVIGNSKTKMLLTTDMLVEGVHFDLSYMPLKHLGYKSVVVAISDIYAMNAIPQQVMVSFAVSDRFSVEALEELYNGIAAACTTYNLDLIGGDTSASHKGLVISVTATGIADQDNIVFRSGAKPADLLCVTGDLGAAFTGYHLLEREKRLFLENPQIQPDLEGHDYIIQRQLKPEARRDIIEWLSDAKIKPTAMIDVSDGLASEVFHLCKNSNIGMVLYEEKLPIDPTTYNMARELTLDPTVCALSGGEDFELLFTLKQSDYEKLDKSPDITVIGYCTEPAEGVHIITRSNNKHALKAQGWTND